MTLLRSIETAITPSGNAAVRFSYWVSADDADVVDAELSAAVRHRWPNRERSR